MNIFQKLYVNFLISLKPIVKAIGKIYPKSSDKERVFYYYDYLIKILKPGYVILTISDDHLSNLINPSRWKHSVVYVGTETYHTSVGEVEIPTVVEATGEGVISRSITRMLASKDRIAVLRPTKELLKNQKQIDSFVKFVKKQVLKPYDYGFDSFSKNKHSSFYCHELTYAGITAVNPEANFYLKDFAGIKTVTGDDLFKMIEKKKFELVWIC